MDSKRIYEALQEACEATRDTLLPGDAEKWRDYEALSPEGRQEWRMREGHEEFCRLQRLAFHCHI